MKHTILFVCLLSMMTSCGNRPECFNRNPIMDMHGTNTPQYKDELLRQIKLAGPGKVTYWIEDYKEINGKPFMDVEVQADSLCAHMLVDIKNPNKVAEFKNVKGISYRGAEINNFQYFVDTADGKYNFVWEEGVIVD